MSAVRRRLLLGLGIAAMPTTCRTPNKLFKQGQHSEAMDKVNARLATNPRTRRRRFLKGLI